MNKPNLTKNTEKRLLSLIDTTELVALKNEGTVSADYYTQLADLYRAYKAYHKEIAILQRFARLDSHAVEDLVAIYERIDKVNRLIKQNLNRRKNTYPAGSGKPELALVKNDEQDEHIHIGTLQTVKPRIDPRKIPFFQQSRKVLTVNVAYTGRTEQDEIIQVGLVLVEFSSRAKNGKIIDSYWGLRNVAQELPFELVNQYRLRMRSKALKPFDSARIKALFQQADFVVSHNQADIERTLLCLMIPEIAKATWYSTQKDIPWVAFGFESNQLSQIAKYYKEKIPQTCIDRAIILARILQHTVPHTTQTYVERLYNMAPMKPFEWTRSLIKQKKKWRRKKNVKIHLMIYCSVILLFIVGIAYYFRPNIQQWMNY
ncbi:hypothetical protein [Aliikangiella maris]|uniref:Uncharacterized protein n=2 Tax=Aliikangiella maris TaxID=3162458 RepID=A0ABV2BT75_9GAMM